MMRGLVRRDVRATTSARSGCPAGRGGPRADVDSTGSGPGVDGGHAQTSRCELRDGSERAPAAAGARLYAGARAALGRPPIGSDRDECRPVPSARSKARCDRDWTELDRRAVDTVRVLAADAVQKVGNGHPGTAMSLAPAAYLLFQRYLRHDPADPDWVGRDRFVLSCGPLSLTLYIQLYLSGYGLRARRPRVVPDLGLADAGPPRATATRSASRPRRARSARASATRSAWRWRRAASGGCSTRTPRRATSPFDHHVYVFASDGDLEEGVTSEASSLAGTQQLGNLTLVWDDNHISIEDDTAVAFSEDPLARYAAYGWHVQSVDWRRRRASTSPRSPPR